MAGWDDLLRGDAHLSEVVIHANADDVSLLPLRKVMRDARDLMGGLQTAVTAGVLRNAYDIVLFDLGSFSAPNDTDSLSLLLENARIDATAFVVDPARTCINTLNRAAAWLNNCDSEFLGIVENFTDASIDVGQSDMHRGPHLGSRRPTRVLDECQPRGCPS